MQFQADLLGVPVIRAANTETTAMGAAYLAGLAVGFYKSKEEIASQWASDRKFEPTMAKTIASVCTPGGTRLSNAPKPGRSDVFLKTYAAGVSSALRALNSPVGRGVARLDPDEVCRRAIFG